MNRFNPKKLLHSKWTACQPKGKERHFMVTEVQWNEERSEVLSCTLQAVINHHDYEIEPAQLKDSQTWKQGWH